jgi:uncharacterized protein YecE (DUF72 family)
MAEIRIGTCSWKYDSWRGIVYPEKGEFDHLNEYARHFDTVEIDQWFWSLFETEKAALPDPAVAQQYAAAVPAGFRFTVKAPNSITLTHHYRKDKARLPRANPHFLSLPLYAEFLRRLEPMADKVALVMLQFEYLNRQKISAQSEFLERLEPFLAARPRAVPLAIECRNPNYLNDAYFAFLRRHDVHHVFCQGYYMPPVWELEEKFAAGLTAAVVIRLMGADRKGIEARGNDDWSLVRDPKDDELRHIVSMAQRLRKRGKGVYININNHYEGSAPRTAEKVRGLLANKT